MALLEATKYILSHVVGKLVFEMFMFLAKTLFIKKKKKREKGFYEVCKKLFTLQ